MVKIVGNGEVHNGITVLADNMRGSQFSHRNVVARCHCGKEFLVRIAALRSGNTKSCGCSRAKCSKGFRREYGIWNCMIARCTDKNHKAYPQYGAVGVAVCERWMIFDNFIADMGPANGLTIDRIDNAGGYCKENCRWATRRQQQNNRSITRFLTFNGKTLPLADWARSIGVPVKTLRARLARGLSIERALTLRGKQ